jgi:hypothetical protein
LTNLFQTNSKKKKKAASRAATPAPQPSGIKLRVPVLGSSAGGTSNVPPIETLSPPVDSSDDGAPPVPKSKIVVVPRSAGKRKASEVSAPKGRASKRSKAGSGAEDDFEPDEESEDSGVDTEPGFPRIARHGRPEAAGKVKGSTLQPVPELSPSRIVNSLAKGSSMVSFLSF